MNFYRKIEQAKDLAAIEAMRNLLPLKIGKFRQGTAFVEGNSVTLAYTCLAKPGFEVVAYLRQTCPLRIELVQIEDGDSIGSVAINNEQEMEEKIRSFVLTFGLDTITEADISACNGSLVLVG